MRSRVVWLSLALAAVAPLDGAQAPTLAIRNATVIAMTGGAALPAATVLIRGDRIAAIGPSAEITIPARTRIVDGTGKFVIPGLIEMHTHLSKARASAMGLFVVNGVTTVRDMGGDYEELRQWRQEVTSGRRLGPRILMAGPILESTPTSSGCAKTLPLGASNRSSGCASALVRRKKHGPQLPVWQRRTSIF